MSLQSFFAMGGYASYVWPAYAVFFAVLIADYVAPVVRRRQLLRDVRARAARHDARRERRAGAMSGSSERPGSRQAQLPRT